MSPRQPTLANSFIEDTVKILEPLRYVVKAIPGVGTILETIIGTALVIARNAEVSNSDQTSRS